MPRAGASRSSATPTSPWRSGACPARRPPGRPRPTATSSTWATGEWLINPGSVGQPRDGDPRAAWLELDLDGWRAVYHRVRIRHRRRGGGDPGRPPARFAGRAPVLRPIERRPRGAPNRRQPAELTKVRRRMRYVPRALLAGLSGVAVSLLAACGSSGSLLSADQGSTLNAQLNSVSAALAAHNCAAVADAAATLTELGQQPVRGRLARSAAVAQGASTVLADTQKPVPGGPTSRRRPRRTPPSTTTHGPRRRRPRRPPRPATTSTADAHHERHHADDDDAAALQPRRPARVLLLRGRTGGAGIGDAAAPRERRIGRRRRRLGRHGAGQGPER